jgi:alpha-amylase
LYGYYLTEDDGQTLHVLPGSEPLRYMIPFQSPQETIAYLGRISEKQSDAFVVFGDDGEKFGTWPETKQHVYESGWLRNFFELLTANKDWIDTTTPTRAMQEVEPLGKVYLPEGSYREMTEWAMPVDRQLESDEVRHLLQESSQWQRVSPFVRGGFWRNFKTRYPESNEMYARMMQVSGQLASLSASQGDPTRGRLLDHARDQLYRAQCNCSYWHGAFGGIYLPHLRNAVFEHLIRADSLLQQASGRGDTPWCSVACDDFNFDGKEEVQLSTDQLVAFIEPAAGGRLYELDIRSITHNLLATLSRRAEAYHKKVLSGPTSDDDHLASIHERVIFKQEGLDQLLQYDTYGRKSLIDHFYPAEATGEEVLAGTATELGDFVQQPYQLETGQQPLPTGGAQLQAILRRDARVEELELRVTKRISLREGETALEVDYLIEQLPADRPLHFAVEWNFAGMPADADNRYFYDMDQQPLGHLGSHLDLREAMGIGLVDQWLGLDVGLSCNRATNFWTFPIATVSQSEGGFEAVHQSVVIMPHWSIQGDAQGRWGVTFRLSMNTVSADKLRNPGPQVAAAH